MIAPVPRDYRGQIVELGAGTGAITLRLAARCPKARILACEINPVLARDNRRNLDAAGINGRVRVVTDPAERLLAGLSGGKTRRPDFIISSIPLGNMRGERVAALIDKINQALERGGLYVQFQHSLMDRKRIRARFGKLRTVPVPLNFPPAVVYYARR